MEDATNALGSWSGMVGRYLSAINHARALGSTVKKDTGIVRIMKAHNAADARWDFREMLKSEVGVPTFVLHACDSHTDQASLVLACQIDDASFLAWCAEVSR